MAFIAHFARHYEILDDLPGADAAGFMLTPASHAGYLKNHHGRDFGEYSSKSFCTRVPGLMIASFRIQS